MYLRSFLFARLFVYVFHLDRPPPPSPPPFRSLFPPILMAKFTFWLIIYNLDHDRFPKRGFFVITTNKNLSKCTEKKTEIKMHSKVAQNPSSLMGIVYMFLPRKT